MGNGIGKLPSDQWNLLGVEFLAAEMLRKLPAWKDLMVSDQVVIKKCS